MQFIVIMQEKKPIVCDIFTKGNSSERNVYANNSRLILGIGMDSCITPLRHGGLSLVQTTDFFYPLVDDPYMMVSLS